MFMTFYIDSRLLLTFQKYQNVDRLGAVSGMHSKLDSNRNRGWWSCRAYACTRGVDRWHSSELYFPFGKMGKIMFMYIKYKSLNFAKNNDSMTFCFLPCLVPYLGCVNFTSKCIPCLSFVFFRLRILFKNKLHNDTPSSL